MVPGEFNWKFKEALCHLGQTEPFTPWSKATEREIKELKKGSSREIKSDAQKSLWNDCLELESYIRFHTAQSIYKLVGDVPETIMSGESANISQFCDFE